MAGRVEVLRVHERLHGGGVRAQVTRGPGGEAPSRQVLETLWKDRLNRTLDSGRVPDMDSLQTLAEQGPHEGDRGARTREVRSMPVTIHDVARRAQVSPSTV